MSAVEELGVMFVVWREIEKLFLQKLLTRIAIDSPEFNREMFLTELQIIQEEFPSPTEDEEAAVGLKFLGELIAVAEAGFAEAEKRTR